MPSNVSNKQTTIADYFVLGSSLDIEAEIPIRISAVGAGVVFSATGVGNYAYVTAESVTYSFRGAGIFIGSSKRVGTDGFYDSGGVKVLGYQTQAIQDGEEDLGLLAGTVNEILSALRAHGIIAT